MKLGVIPADAALTPRPAELPAWDSLSPDLKRLAAVQMELAAAFMAHTDHEIGRLLSTIRTGPRADNTLVMYVVGDNGASGEGGLQGTDHKTADYLFGKATPPEDQLKRIDKLGGPELDNHNSAAWAWAMGSPFPWLKQNASHLGGTRNPLVVSWPRKIAPGSAVRSQFAHVVDVVPTIYEAAGVKAPEAVDGVAQISFDGVSFAQSFADPRFTPKPGRVQYFEMGRNRAIYKDGWMASARNGVPWSLVKGPIEKDRWELYNLTVDFSQAHDLAATHPAKLLELKALYEQEAVRNNVYPAPASGWSAAQDKAPERTYLFYPDLPILASAAAPNFGRAHSIAADVTAPARGEGTILSNGHRIFGGFNLHLSDGYLVFESNVLGKSYERIVSPQRVPAGRVTLGFDYNVDPRGVAQGRLLVNGKVVASGALSKLYVPFSGVFEVGRQSTSPIGKGQSVPYAFSGAINTIKVVTR